MFITLPVVTVQLNRTSDYEARKRIRARIRV